MTQHATLDPRLPILVGTGQISNRVDQGAEVLEPVDLMAEALRRAEDDAGATGLLAAADSVRVVCLLSWRYRDPGALLGERVGAQPRQTVYTVMGGNYVQTLINHTARAIQAGELDVALLAGAESWRSRSDVKKVGGQLEWTKQPDALAPTLTLGTDDNLSSPLEVERGVFLPVQLYPMFDVAMRAKLGLSVDEHRARISGLWSRFSEVAAKNPYAWIQQAYTPEEIAEPSEDNRMIGFPYTKRMNSNNMVEQGAGLIMCSVAKAQALGIPEDRWVFLHAGADAHDHWFVTNRDDLCSSPAIRFAGRDVLAAAECSIDDIAHVDLYSCFPSAVQIGAAELGLGLDRQLTVTGGMSFAGGPWNNYPMHAVATMSSVLRNDAGSLGLCSANGGYTTKHALGIYSTTPPAAGAFRWSEPQAEVDATPSRPAAEGYDGDVSIETYTVMFGRDGRPEQGLTACLTPDGARTWGRTDDADTMDAMTTSELVGRQAKLAPDGTVDVG